MSGTNRKVLFGSFEFDFALQELRRRSLRIRLSVSQIRLLTMFLESPGALISREDIVSRLWKDPQSIDVSNGINTAVNRLRTNLHDDPADPRYIETVVGLGYRFIAKVQQVETVAVAAGQRVDDSASASIAPAAQAVASPASEPEALRQTATKVPVRWVLQKTGWIVAAAAITLIAVSGAFFWRHGPNASGSRLESPPATARFRSVTFNDSDNRVTTAAMSPSGEMIAYSDRSGISVVWPDSGATRLLASPPQFQPRRIDWYPGNKRLAVSGDFEKSYTSQTWQISLDGSPPRLLADDSAEATISPDGKSMAFIRHQGTEIALADAEGRSPHELATAGERQTYRFLLWSRSGSYLVDESSSERQWSDVGASIARSTAPLSDLETEKQWNYETLDVPSGKRLALEENIRFDTGYLLEDGRLFYADGAISRTESVNRLMMVETNTADGRFLGPPILSQTTGGDEAKGFSASLDGRQSALIISRNTADTFVGSLLRPDLELGGVKQISHHSFESYPHAWTPKDDAVLLENNSLGKDAIFEQRLDGSPPKMLAQLSNDAAMPEFTADGRWILFLELSGKPSHVDAIFRVPADGGTPEQVPTSGEIDEFHCPALTGSCVLRKEINRKEFVYYAFDPLQGMGRELARTAWEPALLGEWSLSPDGNTVAVAKHDSFHPGIRLIDLKATPTKISEIPVVGVGTLLGVIWEINARGFFVETETEARHYRLVYVGRAGDLKILRSTLTPIWAVPSHDGTRIAFPEVTFRSNIWSQPFRSE